VGAVADVVALEGTTAIFAAARRAPGRATFAIFRAAVISPCNFAPEKPLGPSRNFG
jgi:hypothetical protein